MRRGTRTAGVGWVIGLAAVGLALWVLRRRSGLNPQPEPPGLNPQPEPPG